MDFLPSNPPRITRIQAKNYRSIEEIDIELSDLTILVGSNGSGKSNVIDVLRFIRDIIQRGLDQAILERHGIGSIRRWSARGRPYDIYIRINIESEYWAGEYSFTLGSERLGEYKVKQERFYIAPKNDLEEFDFENHEEYDNEDEEDDRNPIEMEIRDGKWVKSLEFGIGAVGVRATNLSESKDLVLPSMTNWIISRSSYDFYRFLRNMGFYIIYPKNLREPQKPSNPHPLEEDGQNLASVLRGLKQKKEKDITTINLALENVVEGVHDYSVSQVGGYLITKLHHYPSKDDSVGPKFALAQESDGTLRMLGILTALYQNPPRSLIVIEEPELTIHPGALGVLCDVIKEASLRSQVIITTHNPDLIDRFPDENILVVEKENGITKVGSIISSQREAIREKLFSPGELMRIQGLRKEQD